MKSREWTSIVTLVVSALLAPLGADAREYANYFDNGKWMITDPQKGVFLADSNSILAQRTKILDGPVTVMPAKMDERNLGWQGGLFSSDPAYYVRPDPPRSFMLVEKDGALIAIHQSGKVTELPVRDGARKDWYNVLQEEKKYSLDDPRWKEVRDPAHREKFMFGPSSLYRGLGTARHGEKDLAVVYVARDKSEFGISTSDIYLIREDGKVHVLRDQEVLYQKVKFDVRGGDIVFHKYTTRGKEMEIRQSLEDAFSDLPPATRRKIAANSKKNPEPASGHSDEIRVRAAKDVDARVSVKPLPPELKDYFRDFGAEVAASTNVIGEQGADELYNIRLNLGKSEVSSVMITGDAGSGKTELVKSFVREVQAGKYPEIPVDTPFIMVESLGMSSDTKWAGEFDSKLKDLVDYATENRAILILDEAHTLRGSGTHSNSSVDFFQKIKSQLTDGSLRIIGTTTSDEYQAYFAGDPALARRLPEVKKEPIPAEKLVGALKQWSKRSGKKPLSDGIYEELIRIARDYDSVGTDISRSARLLDTLYSAAQIAGKKPEKLDSKFLKETAGRVYGVDPSHFDPEKRAEKLAALKASLDSKVVGLDEPKKKIVMDATTAMAGTDDKNRPQARRLFAGPKGLAKTYLAETYAKSLGLPHLTINLSEYSSGKSPEDLLRAVGAQLRKNAFSVIIFDEIEKASPGVQNALLQFMNSGEITTAELLDGTDQTKKTYVKVKTANATALFTTNAGQEYVLAHPKVDPVELRAAMVRDGLSEFLVDRMRGVSAFHPPKTPAEFKEVLKLKLQEKLREQEKRHLVKIEFPDQEKLLKELTTRHFKPGSSYRSALDQLDEAVSFALAQGLLTRPSGEKSCPILWSQIQMAL